MKLRALALAALLAAPFAAPAQAQRFDVVAIGDMPYNLPGDYARYDRLIERINALNPAFSLHVGDTKSGSTPCSDEILLKARSYFEKFEAPIVYSIGDNEWTDCHRAAAGSFDPLERLAFVRREHFAQAQSLGRNPMPIERQADTMADRFATYVENSRWTKEGILFVSLHLPGSNNNFETRRGAPEEYFARNAANLAWIADSFAKAAREGAKGVVFVFQANMWEEQEVPKLPLQNGYADTLRAFTEESLKFGKPVLLVQGDSHVLRIDQPLKDRNGRTIETVTRLQVMGAAEVHAVRITIDAAEPGLFGFTPVRVPENYVRR